VDDVPLSWGTGGGAFAQCLSITTALLRGPTSGATEGAGPLELALLLGGVVFLLLVLAGVVFWRARQTRSK
jgi:type II secretory pathway component PulM